MTDAQAVRTNALAMRSLLQQEGFTALSRQVWRNEKGVCVEFSGKTTFCIARPTGYPGHGVEIGNGPIELSLKLMQYASVS
jgi:hypothetical protein